MTTRLRALVGGTALAAGLWFLSGATAAPPVLPADTYKKVAEADVAKLKEYIKVVIDDEKEAKRFGPTVKSLAMMLAMYGEATGDAALKDASLKVAEAAAKKDYKGAAGLADKLAVKGGGKALPPGTLHKLHGFALDEVMSPFRGGKVGGLNIDRDIKDLLKKENPTKPDPVAVELLGARTAILGEYMLYMPNDKAAVNKSNTEKWEKWSKETTELSKQLVAEAAKGKSANEKNMLGLVTKLNAKCSDCHNSFRDD